MKLVPSNLFENLRMGLDTLWQHKLRSLLTILGVVIGTMTVIVIAALFPGSTRGSEGNRILRHEFHLRLPVRPGFQLQSHPGRAHAQTAKL